jgi:hypothetical protein
MKGKPKTEGFNFDPSTSEHYFYVSISSSKDGDVQISEHMSWDKSACDGKIRAVKSDDDERLRVILTREKWNAIADAVREEFNGRLRQAQQKRGMWKASGLIPVSRLFGKELVLLAWAIEDADPALVPRAIMNWLGLTPEERWWLFTMTNAATGQAVRGRGRGWRNALRYALTENPTSAAHPEQWMGRVIEMDRTGGSIEKAARKGHQDVLTPYIMSPVRCERA